MKFTFLLFGFAMLLFLATRRSIPLFTRNRLVNLIEIMIVVGFIILLKDVVDHWLIRAMMGSLIVSIMDICFIFYDKVQRIKAKEVQK